MLKYFLFFLIAISPLYGMEGYSYCADGGLQLCDLWNRQLYNNIEPTLLMLARGHQWSAIVNLLATHSIDSDFRFSTGETLLHRAVQSQRDDVVIFLLFAGINPDAEDSFGLVAEDHNLVPNRPDITNAFKLFRELKSAESS